MTTTEPAAADPRSVSVLGLSTLFGVFYFVQGIAEPTEGLIAQPVRSLLKGWGYDAGAIGAFTGLLAIPWTLKPLYGLLTDFIPLFGYRRKSYLIVTSLLASAVLMLLFGLPLDRGSIGLMFALLLLPTVSIALSDVVVDALMVERGQPLGLTGMLQSVQWGCIYAASVLTGLLGGYLSTHGLQQWAFLICATAPRITLLLAWRFVREPRQRLDRSGLAITGRALLGVARSPLLLASGAFLFLWNFNPFASAVLYLYTTQKLGFSETFYGSLLSQMAVAQMIASFGYGLYCRRISRPWLLHLAILTGIASTLAYWWLHDAWTAILVTIFVGFTNATGTMVTLDLAARVSPPRAAGTIFALLMALSNLGLSAATVLGGYLYEYWSALYGEDYAFHLLVLLGAAFTAGCWLLVPILGRDDVLGANRSVSA